MERIKTLKKLPQHCKRCKKVLRKYNKSGYCSTCGEKTRQEKLIKPLSIFFLLTFFLLSVNMVSAELFQFDNIKQYDAVKQEVTIVNTFGIGEDIAKIKLTTPTHVITGYGGTFKIAEFDLTNLKDYTNALEEIKFYNFIDLKQEVTKNFEYKVKSYETIIVNDYDTCIEANALKCGEQKIIGTHEEFKEVWTPLQKTEFKEGETYTIGIFTYVNKGDYVEWIPTYYGVKINEWASYSASLKSGLQVYYNLNEVSGTNIIDSTNTANATIQGTSPAPNVQGKLGTAWDFEFDNKNQANITGNFINPPAQSLSAWIKLENVINGGQQCILGKDNNNIRHWCYDLGWSGTGAGSVVFLRWQYAVTFANSGTGANVTYNTWHHVVYTFDDASNTLRFWLDGVNIANTTNAGAPNSTESKVSIGATTYNGGTNHFDGVIDELGWWNRTLTDNEVQEIYNSGAGLNYSEILSSTPYVVLNYPTNYTNLSVSSVLFNYTAYDYNLGGYINQSELYIDGISNGINTTDMKNGSNYLISKGLSSGYHNWSVKVWSSNGTTYQSYYSYFNITINSPDITIHFPYSNSNYTTTSIHFNATITDDFGIKNVTMYLDEAINNTDTSEFNGTYEWDFILNEGLHNWSILAYDNDSNPSQSLTIPFTIDLTPPKIKIDYPTNTTYYISYNNNATAYPSINWNAQDEHLSYCTLTNITSGVNITSTCNNMNYTFIVPLGTYTFRTYVNDTFLFKNSTSITATWKYKIFEVNQSYNSPVLENTPQDYYANIYLDSSLSINSVYFNYNETNYSASYSNIGNYTRLEKTNFYTPSVNGNANNSITWWALLNDSSRINLSKQYQIVNNVIYSGVCNATYPYYIFNLTLKDEKTQNLINGTIETDIRIKTANGTTTLYNWSSSIVNTSSYLCSSYPITAGNSYKVDGTIKYYTSNENYSAMVEYYNFLNFSYNNNTYYQNISLYDLNVTEGTEFQLTFKDSSYRAREDILIYVYRQYIPEGIFKVVELPKTDSNGQAVVHLVRNDVIYNIIAVDSVGNVLGALNNVIAFCDDYTIGDCKINFQGTTTETNLENYIEDLGLTYTLSFNSATNLITFLFSFDTLQVKNIRLKVISSAVVTNRTICDTSLSAITGTLTCNVSSVVNSPSAVYVKIFLDNEEIINENLYLDTSDWNISGIIFFGFLLLLIIGIMFIESKEGLIIAVILGFIILISLGIVKGKIIGFTSGVLWLVIVGIILLIKLNKEKQQS